MQAPHGHAGCFVAYPSCPRQYGRVKASAVNAKALANLANAIVDARRRAGMTQEDVAFEAGISVRHYQSLEGADLNPSYLVLLSVSRALKISLARLLNAVER
jgi:ribosome-binding protein aMBF1 (putative translation factor)